MPTGTSTARRGLFLSFEGTDGCGKTTQARRLAARLRAAGHEVVESVEPGGTAIGGQIRRILLDPANDAMAPMTEMLLYFASRAQNVGEVIGPALERGAIVVSDRYTDSTLVYQGAGRGLGEDVVRALHEIACGGLWPDLTLCLDIDLTTSLARARARNAERDAQAESRMDEQSVEFHERVRSGYLRLAAQEPARVKILDARADEEAVAELVWRTVEPYLGSR